MLFIIKPLKSLTSVPSYTFVSCHVIPCLFIFEGEDYQVSLIWLQFHVGVLRIFFFGLDYLSRSFTIHRTVGEGEAIYLTSPYTLPLPPATQALILAGQLLHTAHLCTYVTARPELGTFALRAQVVNHWPARPFEHISILPSLNALRITSWMVKLQVTSKKCNCDFAKVCIQQKSKTNLRIYWITMIRVEIHEMNFWRN